MKKVLSILFLLSFALAVFLLDACRDEASDLKGSLDEAQRALKGTPCTYNLAFAQLMNEETGTAIRTLDCCLNQTADVNYLRAVCYARQGDKSNCLKNLKAAIDDNYDYKKKAAVDTEFKEYWDDEEFKLIIKLW